MVTETHFFCSVK